MKIKSTYLLIIILLISLSFGGGYVFANYFSYNDIFNDKNNDHLEQSLLQESSNEENKNINNTINEKETTTSKNQTQKSTVNKTSTKENKKEEKKVYIDIYYQNGCSYCTKLLNYINNLDDSTKSKIILTKHNIHDNYQQFLDVVKKYDGDKRPGTPYTVFNNQKTIMGYSKDLESKYLKYINELTN